MIKECHANLDGEGASVALDATATYICVCMHYMRRGRVRGEVRVYMHNISTCTSVPFKVVSNKLSLCLSLSYCVCLFIVAVVVVVVL